MSYIKREDAISHPFANGHYDHEHANKDFIRGYESYKEWLQDLPAADVRENVRGEWIDDGQVQICSNCGEEHEWIEYRASYCDNCGADMRG